MPARMPEPVRSYVVPQVPVGLAKPSAHGSVNARSPVPMSAVGRGITGVSIVTAWSVVRRAGVGARWCVVADRLLVDDRARRIGSSISHRRVGAAVRVIRTMFGERRTDAPRRNGSHDPSGTGDTKKSHADHRSVLPFEGPARSFGGALDMSSRPNRVSAEQDSLIRWIVSGKI